MAQPQLFVRAPETIHRTIERMARQAGIRKSPMILLLLNKGIAAYKKEGADAAKSR
jgi:hypothetical protein